MNCGSSSDDESNYEGDHLIAPKPFFVADLLDDFKNCYPIEFAKE